VTVDAETSDSALARLAAAGDDRAFAILVRRHKQGLYRLLRHYSGDPEDAYEAVQEAFIAAWGAMRRYDPQRPFAAWLTTIAINKARDRGRRAAVRRLIFGPEIIDGGEALAAPDLALGADQAMMEDELAGRLDAAIGQLPAALKGKRCAATLPAWP
jgi:RNA polymerase sigma factor (sigma-70 family)